ncbi:MAG: hypothetical protein R3F49_06060 [Planctomycetota bacterium]
MNQALERNALWIPVDGALRRALRALFGDLRAARGTVLTAQWLAARVSTAAVEATDPHSAAEPCEREAWARHLERVAATLGVCSTKSVDALALVHQLELEQRATLLHGITLASQRRTKGASPAFWTRFEGLLRSLMRALTADA